MSENQSAAARNGLRSSNPKRKNKNQGGNHFLKKLFFFFPKRHGKQHDYAEEITKHLARGWIWTKRQQSTRLPCARHYLPGQQLLLTEHAYIEPVFILEEMESCDVKKKKRPTTTTTTTTTSCLERWLVVVNGRYSQEKKRQRKEVGRLSVVQYGANWMARDITITLCRASRCY